MILNIFWVWENENLYCLMPLEFGVHHLERKLKYISIYIKE